MREIIKDALEEVFGGVKMAASIILPLLCVMAFFSAIPAVCLFALTRIGLSSDMIGCLGVLMALFVVFASVMFTDGIARSIKKRQASGVVPRGILFRLFRYYCD